MTEQAILTREFAAELTAGEGRTVDVRIVPYGVPAVVSDGGPVYQEEWAAGCFDAQLKAANRVDVLMNFEHEHGSNGLIGRGTALDSRPDGLHGSFRIFDNDKGNVMLELVREGVLAGISLEAISRRAVTTAAGIVQRVDARLKNVALCRSPAFKDAMVLAVREKPLIDEELLPLDFDPELAERCRKLGIELPARYAHPVEHPASGGTLEDGTRTPITTSSEGTT